MNRQPEEKMKGASGETTEKLCPVCGSKHLKTFFETSNVPAHCCVLWPNRDEARNCPRGDIRLAFCPACSFITNLAFEPSRLEYTQKYENTLHFSPRFQEYATSLATRLVERYDLHNKDIIEIGCGKGDFLIMLCKLGNNRGVGFDATYVPQESHNHMKNVKFIQDFYSENYSKYHSDLIICRQTLEHIHEPKNFLGTLRRTISNRLSTRLFFEVPNTMYTVRKLDVWDIIYEHCSYFTPASLSLIFSSSGFKVHEVTEEFEGQYLCIDALPSSRDLPDSDDQELSGMERFSGIIASFAYNYRKKVEKWKDKMQQIVGRGERAVIWGAGARGVSFLNAMKNANIEYAVDINPRKQGTYIPGTAQEIVSPEFLRDYQPEVTIVMNPIYRNEIQQHVKKLGITTEFMYA